MHTFFSLVSPATFSSTLSRFKPAALGLLSAILLVLLPATATAATLEQRIQQLIDTYKLDNAHIGIAVQRTQYGTWLYQKQAHKLFMPASNNKIFTAIGALFALSRDFRFETSVYYLPAQLHGHTLKGNLYIRFTGDPSLTTSRLRRLVERIYAKGIHDIDGKVIAIADTFSGDYYPKGWAEEDRGQCYGAPASSMNLNHNCMIISLQSTGGKDTQVKRVTNTSHIRIINHARLESGTALDHCSFSPQMSDRNVLSLNGCLPKRGSWRLKYAITNPALKTLNVLQTLVENSRIHYSGEVTIGHLPSGLTRLTAIHSGSLPYLLRHMLRHSDNLYAESLARAVGHQETGTGTIEAGTSSIEKLIHKHLDLTVKGNLHMVDGSGLSHYDEVSPHFMAQLLSRAFNNDKIGHTFYKALPTSGINGTIAYRMNNEALLGKVHAKTGTLDDSSTLSGYVLTKNTHRLSFAIMVNDIRRSQRTNARTFQDKVVEVLFHRL